MQQPIVEDYFKQLEKERQAKTLNVILNQSSPEYIKNFFPPDIVEHDKNGFPVCKFCGEPRYCLINLDGKDRAFPIICSCFND